ncbi:hypothetical protein ACOSQ3_025615 [Xanthoceras sorbifolium]
MDPEETAKLCASMSIADVEAPVVKVDGKLKEEPSGTGHLAQMKFNEDEFWVQVHNIPIVYMNREIGSFIGKQIGALREIDLGTTRDCREVLEGPCSYRHYKTIEAWSLARLGGGECPGEAQVQDGTNQAYGS